MWEILKGIGVFIVLWVVLMGVVYVLSGIQARAWIDVFNKYLDDKLKK